MMEKLAHEIGVPEARIQTWFQNKRSRSRKGVGRKHKMSPPGGGKLEKDQYHTSKPSSGPINRNAVTESDIEEMQEIDLDVSSDCGSAFHSIQASRNKQNTLSVPTYNPEMPMYTQDFLRSYLSCYGFNYSVTDGYSSNFMDSFASVFSAATQNQYTTPLRSAFTPLTPNSSGSSMTSSSASPYRNTPQFLYPPQGAEQSPSPSYSDTCRNYEETQQMEPLDLSVSPPNHSDDDSDIDVCA